MPCPGRDTWQTTRFSPTNHRLQFFTTYVMSSDSKCLPLTFRRTNINMAPEAVCMIFAVLCAEKPKRKNERKTVNPFLGCTKKPVRVVNPPERTWGKNNKCYPERTHISVRPHLFQHSTALANPPDFPERLPFFTTLSWCPPSFTFLLYFSLFITTSPNLILVCNADFSAGLGICSDMN